MTQPAIDPNELLTEYEAARALRISVRTLQAWRTKGIGPKYVKLGRMIRYRGHDLIDYLNSNTH
jgi:hypothetical protein